MLKPHRQDCLSGFLGRDHFVSQNPVWKNVFNMHDHNQIFKSWRRRGSDDISLSPSKRFKYSSSEMLDVAHKADKPLSISKATLVRVCSGKENCNVGKRPGDWPIASMPMALAVVFSFVGSATAMPPTVESAWGRSYKAAIHCFLCVCVLVFASSCVCMV